MELSGRGFSKSMNLEPPKLPNSNCHAIVRAGLCLCASNLFGLSWSLKSNKLNLALSHSPALGMGKLRSAVPWGYKAVMLDIPILEHKKLDSI